MSAVSVSLFAFVQNYWVLLVLSIVAGVGNAVFHPNAYQQVYQISTPANRGTLLSVFSVGGSFGYDAAPLVAGALLVWAGLPGLVFLVVPGAVVAYVLSRFPQKPVRSTDTGIVTGEVRRRSRTAAAMMLGLSSFRSWVYYGFLAFATVYLTTYAGVGYFPATVLVTGMFYAGMAATLVAGFVSDRAGRKEILLVSYVCSVPAYLGIFLLPAPWSLVSLLAAGYFLMAPATIEIATVQELLPGRVGFASGMIMGLPAFADAAAIFMIGVWADSFGMPLTLMMQGILMAAAVVLCLFLPYPTKPRRRYSRTPDA